MKAPVKTVLVALRRNPEVTRQMSITSAQLNSAKWRIVTEIGVTAPILDRPIKVCIATAVWKRPDVFKLFAKGIRLLSCDDVEITVVVAGSEGRASKSLVEKEGFHYIEHTNQPLARKHNAAIKACKKFRPDYVILTGSDDALDMVAWREYINAMRKGIDFIGVLDYYFFDIRTSKTAYWGGYTDMARRGHTCGAFRCISSRLMDMWQWQPFDVKHSHILDDSIQQRLKRAKHTSHIFRLDKIGGYGIDIKSDVNMTPFELWPNTRYVPSDFLKKFPYLVNTKHHAELHQ